MKITFLALLLSAGMAAQTVPTTSTIFTGAGAIDSFLGAHPNATVFKVEQAGITVKEGPKYTFIAGPGLTYQAAGQWNITKPQIQALPGNAGWTQTGAPAQVQIVTANAVSHLKITGTSSVFDLTVAGVAYSSANGFTFPNGGQTWALKVLPNGAEIQTTIAQRQGAKTYSFPAAPSVAPAIAAAGNLTVGSEFSTSRAGMLGANGKAYACSSWIATGGTISFTCDDSQLPDAALPYVIDPTITFNPTSYNCGGYDDGTTCHMGDSGGFTATFTMSLPAASVIFSGSLSRTYNDNGQCDMTENATGPWQGSVYPSSIPWTSLGSGQSITYSVSTYDDNDDDNCRATIGDAPQVTVTYSSPPSGSVSMSPSNPVTGSWGLLTVSVQDLDGWYNVSGANQQIIINTSRTYAGGCNLIVEEDGNATQVEGQATLLDNSGGSIGTDYWSVTGYGSGGTYSSSACAIQPSGGSPFNIPVEFLAGGNLTVYGNFINNDGVSTGWITLGTISVTEYTVATPTFSPTPGTYTSAQTVTISDGTAGATIRYTTDGSTPTETHGSVGSGPVQVSATNTIKAIAYLNGWYDSGVASGTYTITGGVATPTFSPVAGSYSSAQTISISTTTPGATIRYTTDGSTPSETVGTVYSAAVSVSSSETLKAIAYESGWIDSTVTTAAYTITIVATPTFSPGAGTYSTAQSVTISTATTGATIRYTTDGSTPSETAGTVYTGAIALGLNSTTIIKAIAYLSGWSDSAIASGTYTITGTVATPTFSPAAGTYPTAQSVTISTTTTGATIRYTTNGSTPSETVGTVYGGPVAVNTSTTLKAIAYETGWTDSSVSTAAYTIVVTPSITSLNPSSGPVGSEVVIAGYNFGSTQSGSKVTFAGSSYARSLTIDHTKAGASDSTSFPVLVYASDASLKDVGHGGHIQSGVGADILFFADSGGTTQYPSEIESYDNVNGVLWAWVQIPTVSHTTDTTFYIIYGNPAPPARTTGLWNSNFKAVYHLPNNGETLSTTDSTGLTTPSDHSATTTSGQIGSGAALSDSGQWIALGSQVFTGSSVSDWSASCWINFTSTATNMSAIGQYVSSANNRMLFGTNNGKVTWYYDGTNVVSSSNSYNDGAWHHVAFTIDSSKKLRVYVDGSLVGGPTTTGSNGWDAVNTMVGSAATTGSNLFTGSIDEVHIVATQLTADWILTEYDNQKTPGNIGTPGFLTWGSEVVVGSSVDAGQAISWSPTSIGINVPNGAITGSVVVTVGGVQSNGQGFTVGSNPTVATPSFSPASGTYTSSQSVTISTTTPGATIRYTTDGSTPSETVGTVYGGPVAVNAITTLKAIAYESAWTDSSVFSGTYTMTVATPTFNPAAGTYTSSQSVTISTTTPGATIRYTTDGSTPSETAGTVYTAAVTVSTSETLKAIAYEASWADSTVASGAYTITGTAATPTFTPVTGTYSSAQTVTISTTTIGATIRYTTDGSTPSETQGTVYTGPIPVPTSMTLSAVAYKSGWLDSTVSSATYTYNQVTPPPSGGGASLGTPPADSGNGLDPRRSGVRALGAYWGAAGEQVDTDSGNLNFSLPLVNPQARGGWGITLRLSYNSQMWRQDTVGTWLMGQDMGYGLGWRLQAGSLIPIWANSTIHHYLFTDSTGAEYSLTVNNGGVWTSQEGVYISYDSNTNNIYNTDGSFWNMGCTSASGEQDAGTMYPTVIEDTNGNQIQIGYDTGAGGSSTNTSARIKQIYDPRGELASLAYTFTYNTDSIPHLTQISAGFAAPENYTFTYQANQPLNSPLSGASYGNTTLLSGVTITGLNIAHAFGYGTGGEMTSYTAPLGGALGWQYRTFTYSGGISLREVDSRTMQSVSSGSPNTWTFSHPDGFDSSLTYHSWTDIYDSGANSQKVYWSNVVVSGTSLVGPTEYQEQNGSGTATLDKTFGWTTDSAGNAYSNSILTTLDAGTSNAIQTTTTQTLDIYGNLTQQQVYDYGANTPTRTYTFTYLTDANYTSRYIRNRLTGASVGSLGLVSSSYDGTGCGALQDPDPGTNLGLHDSNYGTSFTYRGNPTSKSVLGGAATCYAYQTTGVVYATQNGAGTTITNTSDSSTSYSLPTAITPNGNSSLATTVTYASSWAVTSVTGPNGATANTTYDSYGRPQSSTSSDGAVTNFTYAYAADASTQAATVNNGSGNQWTTTTLDGFGRPTSVQTGHDSTTISETDTQYAPCACSPLGKLWRVSLPYAPGQSQVWTTYTYDSSGRTLTVTQGDGSVTSYAYAGNTSTVTDAAGKWKKNTTDAFGNLAIVTEPDPSSQSGGTVYTYYTYNGANQLTQVSMPRGGQPQIRSFTWSGTDLASATNPENGTISYQYDNAHHVTQRTDAKGQQTQYTYDTYGRLTQTRHYNWQTIGNNPPSLAQSDEINYQYDSPLSSFGSNTWGRLAGVGWGTPGYTLPTMWYEYNYNQAGRVAGQRMAIPLYLNHQQIVQDLDTSYTWDNLGRMTSLGVPLGATYQYTYDAMSNLSSLAGTDGYTASAQYNWAGMRTSLSYGGYGFAENRTYNNLLQLSRLTTTSASCFPGQQCTYTALVDTEYLYQTGQNNGRITQSVDHVLSETVNYTYDSLNRLVSAEEASSKWGNAFSYDGWGNLNGQTWTPGYAATPGTVTQGPFDANGNYVGGASNYVYDVENRLISEPSGPPISTNLGYDPWGKRVSWSQSDGNGGSVTNYTVYGANGRRLATYQLTVNDDGSYTLPGAASTNVYFGGTLIASNGVSIATDRLGSVRANSLGEQMAYYPYGLERILPGQSQITPDGREKFGTYFRDSSNGISGQDYADQRYYNQAGAFWSPDPAGMTVAAAGTPISWNLYAYAGNDPVNFTDPSGGFCIFNGFEVPCGEVPPGSEPIKCDPGVDEGCGDPCNGSYFAPTSSPWCFWSGVGGGGGGSDAQLDCGDSLAAAGILPMSAAGDNLSDVLLGENSWSKIGTKQYQNGDAYGHPSGLTITAATIGNEDNLMLDVIANLASAGDRTLSQETSSGAFLGYGAGQAKFSNYQTFAVGSSGCNDLTEVSLAVDSFVAGGSVARTSYNQWRGIVQRNRKTGKFFARHQNPGDLRVGGTDFFTVANP